MYPVGVLVFLSAFLPQSLVPAVVLAIPSAVFTFWILLLLTRKEDDHDAPVILPGCSIPMAFSFFWKRFDFLNQGFSLAGQSIYRFKLLQNTVIVASGAPARRDFFQAKELDLTAGFQVLSGAIPMLPGVTTNLEPRQQALIYKRLAAVQNSERLSQLLPKILHDAQGILQSWGESGTLDPFRQIPQLTFQTNVRSIASAELADNAVLVSRLRGLYDRLDSYTTPTSVLLPWLPSLSTIVRLLATKNIFCIISAVVDARSRSGTLGDDTLQLLLDNGDDRMTIIGFIMGLLIAGARSTGTTASWLITFLAGHPQWKERAALEARRLLTTHAPLDVSENDLIAGSTSLPGISAALASIPLAAWESDAPVLDALIRETLRLAEPHTAMRMHIGTEPVDLAGARVHPGTFVVYPFSDVHLSAELYPNPWQFDPARVESKMPFSFVGWGAGKTMCLGQRLAKLELKLITALIVLGFELTPVDCSGKVLAKLPRPDWNDTLACKPADGTCYLQYRRTYYEKDQ